MGEGHFDRPVECGGGTFRQTRGAWGGGHFDRPGECVCGGGHLTDQGSVGEGHFDRPGECGGGTF